MLNDFLASPPPSPKERGFFDLAIIKYLHSESSPLEREGEATERVQ
jgi:hypothetical protein